MTNHPQLNDLVGEVLDNDIMLESLIGEGGMGLIYRGHQKSLDRYVCVKFVRAELVTDRQWLIRFHREAAALCQLRHDNVCKVYSTGLYKNIYPFMVLELLEGRSLRDALVSEGKIPWRLTCNLFVQVCRTLAAVHSRGLIHRDLKPDNIFLTKLQTGSAEIKILDFGLCAPAGRDGSSTITATGDLIGSVFYMAPECFRGATRNANADIYAIGCMLFECLSGQPPFTADSMPAMAMKHSTSAVPALPASSTVSDNMQGAPTRSLNAIIAKCCAKEPSKRFQTCDEIAAALDTLLDSDHSNESICFDRTPQTSKRAVAVLIACCLFPGVLALAHFAGIAKRERADAFEAKLMASRLNSNIVQADHWRKTNPAEAIGLYSSFLNESKGPQRLVPLVHLTECLLSVGREKEATASILEAFSMLPQSDNWQITEESLRLIHYQCRDKSFLGYLSQTDRSNILNQCLKLKPNLHWSPEAQSQLSMVEASLYYENHNFAASWAAMNDGSNQSPKNASDLMDLCVQKVRQCNQDSFATVIPMVKFLAVYQPRTLTTPAQVEQFVVLCNAVARLDYENGNTARIWNISHNSTGTFATLNPTLRNSVRRALGKLAVLRADGQPKSQRSQWSQPRTKIEAAYDLFKSSFGAPDQELARDLLLLRLHIAQEEASQHRCNRARNIVEDFVGSRVWNEISAEKIQTEVQDGVDATIQNLHLKCPSISEKEIQRWRRTISRQHRSN